MVFIYPREAPSVHPFQNLAGGLDCANWKTQCIEWRIFYAPSFGLFEDEATEAWAIQLPILDTATYLAQGGLDSTLGWHFSTDPSVTFDKPYTLLWGFFGCVCALFTQTTIEHGDP